MSYYVSLGDIELDKVSAVTRSSDRDISVYDIVGGGKFPVPQSRGLRSWTIKCNIDDYDIVKDLDKMQKKDTPVRLVINSDDYKVSERVLLKSHNEDQEYAGVWPMTLTVIEYVKAAVKTTDVPYVAREGNRVLAATTQVTVTEENQATWAYDGAKVVAELAAQNPDWKSSGLQRKYTNAETGKEVNPTAVKVGDTVNISYVPDSLKDAQAALAAESAKGVSETKALISKWGKKLDEAIAKGYEDYNNLMGG